MNPLFLPSPRVRISFRSKRSSLIGAIVLSAAGVASVSQAASFTPGNIAVLQADASASNTTASVIELSPITAAQTPSNTIAIDGITAPNSIRFSGSATSTGYLTNSADGSLLVFTGGNTTTSGATNINTILPRAVCTFNAAGTFNLATTYTGANGNQARSATSLNNTTWFIADQGGVYTNGTTSTSPSGNFRSAKAFGGVVYLGQASSTAGNIQVSTISAATGGTITGLLGLANNANLQDFCLISSGSNGSSFDVLYTLSATSNTAGTIAKYSLVGGTWTANGTYTTTFGGFGLAAADNGAGASVYVSSGQGALTANNVLKIADTAGYNAAISITTANNVTLYTAPTGKIVKGVAFAPQQPGVTSVDLSKYVRVGRYDLPEPTRTIPPSNSLLAQEASGVTYNWDTGTLFIVGDGGTSVTEVTKTGAFVSSMTLPPGGSPQGTEFFDTEGITYIGGGQFVMTEERDRQAVKFTYVAGGTLTRASAQTVKLGTTIGNIGIEGLSYDPLTSGFIFTKELDPEGLFQTTIDFSAGTASNGSPSTVNSTNLFDPALANLEDMSDVFAFSSIPSMTGQPQGGNLLILSQESGKIRNVDRSGNILSTLTLVADAGNPLTIQNQTHEGVTMDRVGNIYVVNENGGGDADHPQLWVYAPSTATNAAPTALALSTASTSISESTSTTAPIKLAIAVVTDADGVGVNDLTLSGPDAASFQIIGSGLYLKAGTALSFNTKPSYSVGVNVDDTTVGGTPDASADFTLNLTQVAGGSSAIKVTEVAPWSSGNSAVGADWFELTNTGSSAVDISGWKMNDSAASFGSAGALSGITSIAAGESVIFVDGSSNISGFVTNWYGASAPVGLQIGYYGGPGLSTGGDAVNIYNADGILQANVVFGTSTPAPGPFLTFDNTTGLNNTTITQLSSLGANGAFTSAATTNEVGSPGSAVASSTPLVSITATDANASETGTDPGSFRISRTGSTTLAMDVVYSIATGSGQATSADYTPTLASPATIPSGQSFVDVTITPVDDSVVESPETVTLTLGDTGSYDVGSPASATVTIIDNDVANLPPTAVALTNKVATITENTPTTVAVKVADISVTDDGQGTNNLTVTGTDAAFFEITGSALYLKAGTTLNFATKPNYSVAVNVDDTTVGSSPDASVANSLAVLKGVAPGSIIISEVAPWSSGNSPAALASDWFEVTNTGTSTADISGWKWNDSANAYGSAIALNGITSIAPGESVIFIQTTDLPTKKAAFLNVWFGANPPAGLQFGSYTGPGLSSGGDGVNLYDTSGNKITGVSFGASPTGPYATFDNKAGLGSTTTTVPAVMTLSSVGVNGAFFGVTDVNEIGSPGTTYQVTFLGVSSGDADSTSATLWTRINETIAPVLSAQVSTDLAFTAPVSSTVSVDPARDYTAKLAVNGLTSATKYYYRFVVTGSGETSNVGTFKTAPVPTAAAPLHFAFSGDMDGTIRPYALASAVPAQNLDFYVNLGDVIYENASNLTTSGAHNGAPWLNSPSVTLSNDSLTFNGVPRAFIPAGTPFATQAQLKADYQKKYRENFLPVNTGGQSALRDFYAAQGNYTTWDNHELGNRKYIDGGAPAGGSVGGAAGTDMPTGRGADARDNGAGNPGNINDVNTSSSDIMNRSLGFQTLRDVFTNYQPIADRGTISAPADPRTDGSKRLYSAQQWGKHATYINTDARSYRDIRLKTANAAADDTGVRADNANRTYLGATQFAWLKQTLLDAHNAGTVWKFVSISDPIDQIGPIGGALSLSNLPSFGVGSTYAPVNADGGKAFMGGYRAERNALLKFIVDHKITNVVFLSTDDHQNRINELTYSPTGQTGVQSSYMKVPYCFSIVCGPLGATGPDLITNHTFSMAQQYATSLLTAQQAAGVEPLGLIGYPGLKNLQRVGDPTAGTSPQAVDFYSPDTFNFTTLDVSADGKTLSVSSIGMDATAQNSGIEYANGPQAQTIFSFQIDAPTPLETWRAYHFGNSGIAGDLVNDADYDHDGIENLVEYALGTDPTLPSGTNGPAAQPSVILGDMDSLLTDRLTLSFSLQNPNPSDITYTVQATDDLGTWTPVASKIGAGAWTWLGGDTSHIVTSGTNPITVKVGDLVPISGNPKRMMRLKVTNP